MFNAKILNSVSIDDKPEFEIGPNIPESVIFFFGLFLGFILGLIVFYTYREIKDFIEEKKSQKSESKKTDEEDNRE